MGETRTGIRSLLSNPWVYDFSQTVFGADRSRRLIVDRHIRPGEGERMLDIGCGTGELLRFLPASTRYWGFDPSRRYIDTARSRYGSRGDFSCADLASYDLGALRGSMDLVVALGVVHHLDDSVAALLFSAAREVLRPGGRLVTVDPVFHEGQSWASRILVSMDRGNNVRDVEGYGVLARSLFTVVTDEVCQGLLRIPYAHCIMECRLSPGQAAP